jgi:hypothetical protein
MAGEQANQRQAAHLSDEQGNMLCVICQAAYTPVLQSQRPWMALEAAFLSMCHFCFRCRRPACPECWDESNGICADCVREMQFSAPSHLVESATPSAQPLICIRHGRFSGA